MINRNELNLLISILNQVDKFGLDTFHSLCNKVNIDDIDLKVILSVADMRSMHMKENAIDRLLEQQTDVRKKLILDLVNLFKNKRFTLPKSVSLLKQHNIHIQKVNKKGELYTNLINELSRLDSNTLINLSSSIHESIEKFYQNDPERSLEAWSNIILKKR